ncbi:MAG: hypothetical protein N2Z65_00730 [Clostridiales bacterium]|nr:hypothetical protein [Clostridiales bacterium]
MVLIELDKDKEENTESLLSKQQEYVDKINSVDAAYSKASKKLLEEGFQHSFITCETLDNVTPEEHQLSSILIEQQNTLDKITTLNNQAIEKAKQYSSDFRAKISTLKKRQDIYKIYSPAGFDVGLFFNYKEGE